MERYDVGMIEFQNVTKKFRGIVAVDDVSFTIHPGEFVCLTGPSGAGKSTIVHLLIRAEVPSSGAVLIDGQNLAKIPLSVLQLFRRRTGVVFQDGKLLSDRTVYENIAFAMEVCGDADAEIQKRVPELLERVGILHRARAYPHELSGGEHARAALARALVHKPMIIIADEPTGNIDPLQAQQVLDLLLSVNREGTTVMLATHDTATVDRLQTRVLRIEQGKLVRDSVGSYGATVATTPARSSENHNVFDARNGVDTDVVPVKSASRKIKPIAIGE